MSMQQPGSCPALLQDGHLALLAPDPAAIMSFDGE
jgi:hypothetical protein